jgi:hypothetical protein
MPRIHIKTPPGHDQLEHDLNRAFKQRRTIATKAKPCDLNTIHATITTKNTTYRHELPKIAETILLAELTDHAAKLNETIRKRLDTYTNHGLHIVNLTTDPFTGHHVYVRTPTGEGIIHAFRTALTPHYNTGTDIHELTKRYTPRLHAYIQDHAQHAYHP